MGILKICYYLMFVFQYVIVFRFDIFYNFICENIYVYMIILTFNI